MVRRRQKKSVAERRCGLWDLSLVVNDDDLYKKPSCR